MFSLIKTVFLYFFCFSKYKMVHSEYSTDDCMYSKISIEAIMKNV